MVSAPTRTTAPSAPSAPSGSGGEPPGAGQVAARRWRASRGVLLVVLAIILLGLGLAAMAPSHSVQRLDPESAGEDGTRALAQILDQRGTPVRVSRQAADAARQATAGTTLIITRSERLTRTDIDRLRTVEGDLLLVEPSRAVLRELVPGVDTGGGSFEAVAEPECELPAARLAGTVQFGRSETYAVPPGGVGCYLAEETARLVQVRDGTRTITVLGSAEPLTNENLTEQGNAALAMNLMGARSEAVWLIPDLPQPGSGSDDESIGDLLPFGVKLFFLQLLVAVVLVALWRVRRMGPVVAEALPVVVRSAEAVEGRSRLYRAHHARGSAAEALRAGARERLVPLLGLPRSAADDPESAGEITTAVAQRTTYDEAMVGVALYGPEPADDGQLVGLSDLLDDLERQVRHS
jgi:hypothetical protein